MAKSMAKMEKSETPLLESQSHSKQFLQKALTSKQSNLIKGGKNKGFKK